MFRNIISLVVLLAAFFAAGCTQVPVRPRSEPSKQVTIDWVRPAPDLPKGTKGVEVVQLMKTVPEICEVETNEEILPIATREGESVSVKEQVVKIRYLTNCPQAFRPARGGAYRQSASASSVNLPSQGSVVMRNADPYLNGRLIDPRSLANFGGPAVYISPSY